MKTVDKLRQLATLENKNRNVKDNRTNRVKLVNEIFKTPSRDVLTSDEMRGLWDIMRTDKPV